MQIYRNGEDITGETIICVAGSTVDNLSVVFTDDSGNDVTDSAMSLFSGGDGFHLSWADRFVDQNGRRRLSKKIKRGYVTDSQNSNLTPIKVGSTEKGVILL